MAVTVAGIALLASLLLAGWLPPRCPLLRGLIVPCPVAAPTLAPSPDRIELGRVPHQDATAPLLSFATAAQDYRAETLVTFAFRAEAPDEVAFLQLKYADGYKNLALVTHPLLRGLSWQSASEPGLRLFQRVERYGMASDLAKDLPPAGTLAADKVAAASLSLPEGSYVPLEPLTGLAGIDYVLTSQPRLGTDGSWSTFSMQFNLSDAPVEDGRLEWMIARQGTLLEAPLRIGTVHVDYQKVRP